MRSSPWSLSVLMIVLGVALLYFARGQGFQPTMLSNICGGALIGAGLLMLLRRPLTWYIALAAGLLTLGAAIASAVLRRDLVPSPMITGIMGLLVTARVILARSLERRERERQARLAEQRKEDGVSDDDDA